MKMLRAVVLISVALALALCVVFALVTDARATTKTTVVSLVVRIGKAEPAGVTTNQCKVRVPFGASGMTVLETAKRAKCIDSYALLRDDWGVRAACVNGLCEAWPTWAVPPFYLGWDIYFPGELHWNQRLDRFRAGRVMKVLKLHYNMPL